MILDNILQKWAWDRDRHRASEARVNAFAQNWNQTPYNRRIAATVASVATEGAGPVAKAIEGLFWDHGWVDALIGALSREMRSDPFFVPPFRHLSSDVHQGLVIYEDPMVSIAIGVSGAAQLAAKKTAPRGATSIGFSGQIGLFKFIQAGQARLSFWEAPQIGRTFSRASAGQCRKVSERRIDDGEILAIDGRRQSFVIEQARSNLLILQATIKPEQAPLSVEYDSRSHEFVGCSAADDSASRIQMIASLLGKLGRIDAFETLAAFLDNDNFYVRWHIMRELLGLDAHAALPLLQGMATTDPHPDNRKAAQTVLDTIDLRKAA